MMILDESCEITKLANAMHRVDLDVSANIIQTNSAELTRFPLPLPTSEDFD